MSSEIVIEIANFKLKAPDAYKTDPSVFTPALELLASKGALNIWHGLQLEDDSTFYFVIAWSSLAEHQALIDDKEAYTKLAALLTPATASPVSLYHVAFKPTPIPFTHFNAPITEFAIQTLVEGKANADLEGLVWNPDINAEGVAFANGKVVEKDNQYVLVKGWESIEAAAIADPNVTKFVDALRQLTNTELKHAQLTAFKA